VPSKSNKQENFGKNSWRLEGQGRKWQDPDPDPLVRGMDPQHCLDQSIHKDLFPITIKKGHHYQPGMFSKIIFTLPPTVNSHYRNNIPPHQQSGRNATPPSNRSKYA
jgi:hypothetical protein